jgi:hypothetical protein
VSVFSFLDLDLFRAEQFMIRSQVEGTQLAHQTEGCLLLDALEQFRVNADLEKWDKSAD